MRAKSARRKWAETLRREAGLSYSEITARTGIPQSTLSGWLRLIPLTAAQQARLAARLEAHRAGFGARMAAGHQARFQQAREAAAQAGAMVAAQLPEDAAVLELALAMLYLGEGSKRRGALQLVNMNPDLVRFFLTALRRLYAIDEARLSLRLHLAVAARALVPTCRQWWGQQLSCPPAIFRPTQFDRRQTVTATSADYHGVCTVTYNDTYLHQRVLGLGQACVSRSFG